MKVHTMEPREISAGNQAANAGKGFQGNSIRTSKYTSVNFFPKALYEQFRRVANLYFLFIAAFSCTPLSPVTPVSNTVPLVFVIGVSLLKELYEDLKRHKSDDEVNSGKCTILHNGKFVEKMWKEIQVGDYIKVSGGTSLPCDIALIASTNPEGVTFVETMNLDGETNLKMKKALEATVNLTGEEALSKLNASVECEHPNNRLYTFTGNLIIDGEKESLGPNQILLRGCSLRNTSYIEGIVIFTGHETKVMMNSLATPSKRSSVERSLDKLILFMFALEATMCTIDAIGLPSTLDKKQWYLGLEDAVWYFDPDNKLLVGVANWVTLLVLYSTLIPISLYVSLEIIKFVTVQSFINNDRTMYHAETDTPAVARTSNLNEELGQIQYIFSDKTGTLTQNLMEFFKCSIAGEKYGSGVTEIQRANARRTGKEIVMPTRSKDARVERGFNFDDARLMHGRWQNNAKADVHKEFFRLLALCHTVIPEGPKTVDAIKYQASSPDEEALVVAGKQFGFFFHTRNLRSVIIKEEFHPSGPKDVSYEILNVLEFNSTRKRQSTILRSEDDGQIILYCKGADNVIYDRLKLTGNEYRETTKTHLQEYGEDGLRTLCLAYRHLDAGDYEQWNAIFEDARTSLVDREEKMDAAAELIEKDLLLIGCTAIEDKLQNGVPESIEQLANAGLKIWVLTGDKVETAINIGFACSLLTLEQRRFVIDSETPAIVKAEANCDSAEFSKILRQEIMSQMGEALAWGMKEQRATHPQPLAVVIDGKALQVCFETEMDKRKLLDLGLLCKAVVCCRVSPLQKALVTTLVKDGAHQITLGIGDGANDVGMIQSAHIGVGISGCEGMQAVMASDFAIAQFRFLTDLLLVHGRWSYIRISKVIGYFFYKNTTYTFTNFWFNLYACYSGQRFYDDYYQSFYNVLFTSFPVLIIGLFDQDVSKTASLRVPGLYGAGQRNDFFKTEVLATWIGMGLFQSLICFYVPVAAMHPTSATEDGLMLGVWAIGTAAYSCIIMTVNIRLALAVSFHTVYHHICIWGSIALWYIFILGYCAVKPGHLEMGSISMLSDTSDNVYYLIYQLFECPNFWLILLITPTLALLPELLIMACTRWFFPRDYHIIQEQEAIFASGSPDEDPEKSSIDAGVAVQGVNQSRPNKDSNGGVGSEAWN
ncbi:hypothetical protein CYMTET_18832 [Cymbomonas tetramitiformis]|uniref:Phospholipid-transporting ATPase n=1 Tax=Cymbomonas tetramitiformis TaxID=36881 RepID=A0AAE0L5V2_9CHLO|nr:hypothetical protein CYMTET_18832 [Cymbomonas tetramitiformis]